MRIKGRVRFDCDSFSNIRWFHMTNFVPRVITFLTHERTLIINDITKSHAGTYFCNAHYIDGSNYFLDRVVLNAQGKH